MTRQQATLELRKLLDEQGLKDWSIRLTQDMKYVGLCSYQDKCIILSTYHIDISPDAEIINTIRHEVAHALTPGQQHNSVWATKARELGCDNTMPCLSYSLSPEAIDAIRSGAQLEITFEEQVIRTPKYKVTRLQDKCPECGKVAVERASFETRDKAGNDVKIITLQCWHIIKKIIPKATPFEDMISFGWQDEIKNCKHEWNKNTCIHCKQFKFYPFQVESAKFAEKALALNKGAIVAHEMGLGKTPISLAIPKFHPEYTPFIAVVKSGLRYQLFKEIIRWLGLDFTPQIINTSKDIILPYMKAYIISYDLLRRMPRERVEQLKSRCKLAILDECQHIKNPDSTRTQEVRGLIKDMKVIPLSGTPWKNRGSEFFTALNMVDPTRFNSYQRFLNSWVETYFSNGKVKEGGISRPAEFKEYTKDILIRYQRTEVMSELPLISRTLFYTELDPLNQSTYDESVSDFVKWYNSAIIGGEEDSFETQTAMIAKISRMRHITGLAKIEATLGFLEDFIHDTDRKIVVFVHHKDVGELLHKACKEKFSDIPIMRLSAELNGEERFDIQERFNKLARCILIASTIASGEGLNLQTCSDCIMHERQWNPANEEQAEGRFIRIGQTAGAVTATYMIAAETVDDLLTNIVEAKRKAFHDAMNKGEMPQWKEAGIVKDLAGAIVDNFNKNNGKKHIANWK